MVKLPSLEEIKDKWYLYCDILEENRLSLYYCLMIVINQIAYGISCKITTPTGTDLRHIYSVTQFTVDNLNTPMYTGFLLGSFVNYLYKYLNRQLSLVLFVLVISLTIAILPHLPNIWWAYVVIVFTGIGAGAWEAGLSMWLIEIWPSKIAVLFQVNQFAYNLGTGLTYALTAPFIWEEALVDERNRSLTTEDRRRILAMPYSINAYLQSIIPLIFLAFYFVNRYQRRSFSKKIHNHNIDSFLRLPLATSNRTGKMVLCFTWVTVYLTAELAYLTFFATMYATLQFTADQIRQINIVFLSSYTLGPLVATFLTFWYRLENLILAQYILAALSFTALYFSLADMVFVLGLNFLLGFSLGPILPAILAFSEMNLQLSARNVSLYTFLCGLAWLLTPFVARAGLAYTVDFLFYYAALCLLTSFVLYCIARWWLFHNSRKFSVYLESQTNLQLSPMSSL